MSKYRWVVIERVSEYIWYALKYFYCALYNYHYWFAQLLIKDTFAYPGHGGSSGSGSRGAQLSEGTSIAAAPLDLDDLAGCG